MSKLVSVILVALALSIVALAQDPPADAYQVRYAANLNIGDSVIDLTNAGTAGGFDPGGTICANVYVFDPSQELGACCACPLTPNALAALSVKNDLISNWLTPGTPTGGVTIALLATKQDSCDAATVTLGTLVGGLRAWGTTLHALPGGTSYALTETAFARATLSASELLKLKSFCGMIEAMGSGFGICSSCREGSALGAAKQ